MRMCIVTGASSGLGMEFAKRILAGGEVDTVLA
ncbi:MAG TPA: short chain dehydrogenase, partial [Ruminococcaceae bacterium]|nr:short chain dehydrogenase [Oscillospiraceae bacterium]